MASERTGIESSRTGRDGGGQDGGGGPFPGYGGVPPAVSTTAGSAGAAATLSRSDHTHLLAAATQSTPGSMAANDKLYLDFLSGKWWEVQARWMKATFPNISAVSPPMKLGQYPLGSGSAVGLTGANTLGVEGGGVTAAAGGFEAFASQIFSQVMTVADAVFVCRAQLILRAGSIARLELFNLTNHDTWIGTDNTNFPNVYVVGAGTTNAAGQGVATGTNVGTGYADFAIGFKDTHVYYYLNQAQIATQLRASLGSDEGLFPCLRNTTLGDAGGLLMMYGYQMP